MEKWGLNARQLSEKVGQDTLRIRKIIVFKSEIVAA